MRKRLLLTVCFGLGVLFSLQLSAQEASPPRNAEPVPTIDSAPGTISNTVQVLLVKSWGATSVWEAMSTNWQDFGTIPVSVDYTTYIDSDFTYQDLVNSGANVIVLSDPAGGTQQYSQAEIDAVGKYAQAGHTVIGTYAVFQFGSVDNRRLAPIFGLSSKVEYNTTQVGISNDFKKLESSSCLLTGISGTSWQSDGYPYTQVPASGTWVGSIKKTNAVAESDKGVGVVSVFTNTAYTGVFVSNFPEYNGGTDDEQLLYNAVTCYAR